jgi:hypothetical protein
LSEAELLKYVFPIERDDEDCEPLRALALTYLAKFRWARPGRMWGGECIPGVIGIFLVELQDPELDVDPFIWVVVGDLPPAYLSPVYASSPKDALCAYIAEMSAWVEAVEKGEDTSELIPVNGEPTLKHASMLKTRLAFLEREIVPDAAGDPD